MFATAVFSPYFHCSEPDCAAQNSEIGGKLVGQDFLLLVLTSPLPAGLGYRIVPSFWNAN